MKSVIYIDRNNLYFYGSNVHAPVTLPFQPTTVRDIEVINSDEFEKQLNEFIKKNKIEPTDAILIIAHQSSFEKLIDPKTPADQIEPQKKQFLDNVPFEQVLSKTFVTTKGTKIIAANKDLAYLIRDIFNKNHFNVEVIASIATLFPEGDVTFNTATAQQILSKASQFKQNMFLLKDVEIASTDMFEENYGKEKKNVTLLYLIPVFVVLIAILVWLIINQQNARNSKRTASPAPSRASAQVAPTIPAVLPQEESTREVELLAKETIQIEVLNGSGIPGQADDVRELLVEGGYTNVTTGNSPTLQSSRTLIIFKSRIPIQQREEISDLISDIVGEVTSQINEEIEVDVLITTSSSGAPQNSPTQIP